MAVQKKSKTTNDATKKPINWTKVCIVGFCVLLVVMCILSFSNFSNFFGDKTQQQQQQSVDTSNYYKFNQSSLANALDTLKTQLENYTPTEKKTTVAEGDEVNVTMVSYIGDTPTSFTTTKVKAGEKYESSSLASGLSGTDQYEINATEMTNIAKNVVGKSTYTQLEADGSGTTGESYAITMSKSDFQKKYNVSDEEYAKFTTGMPINVSGSIGYLTVAGDNQYTITAGLRGGVITDVNKDSISYNIGSDKVYYFVTPVEKTTTTDTSSSTTDSTKKE